MPTTNQIWIYVLVVVCVILIFMIWYVAKAEVPTPGNCSTIQKYYPNQKWNSTCTYIQELTPDPTLTIPTLPLYLYTFTASPNSGPPLGANVWYRYRYVDSNTGGYSAFSPWTPSAVMAGSNTLPCENGVGQCSSLNLSGGGSCKCNIPQLAVSTLAYSPESGTYANVHRYVSPPSDSTQPSATVTDEIIGVLLPMGNGGQIIDASPTPCTGNLVCNVSGQCS